jgi:transcriptional regulator with XRE-family HTH domain
MIKNERQFQVAQRKLAEFRASLDRLKENKEMRPEEIEIRAEFMQGQMDVFEEELEEYEKLKSGRVCHLTIHSIQDISNGLIRARIGRGWSQAELADRLGTQEQQVQRYESSDYESASLGRIIEVSKALRIDLKRGQFVLEKPHVALPANVDRVVFTLAAHKLRSQKSLLISENKVECEP